MSKARSIEPASTSGEGTSKLKDIPGIDAFLKAINRLDVSTPFFEDCLEKSTSYSHLALMLNIDEDSLMRTMTRHGFNFVSLKLKKTRSQVEALRETNFDALNDELIKAGINSQLKGIHLTKFLTREDGTEIKPDSLAAIFPVFRMLVDYLKVRSTTVAANIVNEEYVEEQIKKSASCGAFASHFGLKVGQLSNFITQRNIKFEHLKLRMTEDEFAKTDKDTLKQKMTELGFDKQVMSRILNHFQGEEVHHHSSFFPPAKRNKTEIPIFQFKI